MGFSKDTIRNKPNKKYAAAPEVAAEILIQAQGMNHHQSSQIIQK
jgi:hypothetical protein